MDDGPKHKSHLLDDMIAVCVSHGLTDEATGDMVGTSARTVRRRRQNPVVADKVAEFVTKRAEEVQVRLSSLGAAALDVYADAMYPDEHISYRISGANSTMKNLHAFRSTADLERRVVELEDLCKRLETLLDNERLAALLEVEADK
ncbi:MAG: hypothetical protein ACRCW4_10750 [Candidatus Neomicrothrix subdominans]|jgi:hypothetical protein